MLKFEIAVASDILFLLTFTFGWAITCFGILIHLAKSSKRKFPDGKFEHWIEGAKFPYKTWYIMFSNEELKRDFEATIRAHKSNWYIVYIIAGLAIVLICLYFLAINLYSGVTNKDYLLIANVLFLVAFSVYNIGRTFYLLKAGNYM